MRANLLLCIVLVLASILAPPAVADDGPLKPSDFQVLKPGENKKTDPPPARGWLYRSLVSQAQRQFDARRQAIAAIKTPEDIARRQKELRAFFLRSLGDLPERTPMNPHVVGTLRRDGYRIEKVIFESRPNHHVTANLYIPEGKSPFPGILLPCGHSDNGKAYEGYQRACILLAKNGMAVLCYDPIGQGERNQRLDAQGKPAIRGTTEHTMAGLGALLVGRQLASYRIWDGLRALDYLASRPEIDPTRLGCTGNSGGGTMTAYLMALDDRIAVAAPSCFITSLERLFATIGPQDAEQNINGQVAAGLEHADYVTLHAPKPTLLTVGTRDFFDIDGSWNTFREAKLIFGRLGYGERVDLFESDEEHGFTRPRRIATARWMMRWLLKKDEAVDEPDSPIAADAELQCTRSGQVITDFKDRSVFDFNADRARALQIARDARNAGLSDEDFRKEVERRLGLVGRSMSPVRAKVVETISRQGYKIRKLTFPVADVDSSMMVTALDISKDRSDKSNQPTLVEIGLSGKADLTAPGAIDALMGPAGRVVLLDPRGMGETDPGPNPVRSQSPFGNDVKEAFLSFHLDRPLLGQRAADILRVLAGLDGESGDGQDEHNGFRVVGIGTAGPIVLHAALLDRVGLIKEVVLERSLGSWTDIVERGISRGQIGNVVPGALEAYDLPDLAARLAPRPLRISEPVDAIGHPIPKADLERAYAACIKAYAPSKRLELGAVKE
ncbi:MAG: prolyl oligopeptidase family serine peptidase [Isosphaeraceae bacterium]